MYQYGNVNIRVLQEILLILFGYKVKFTDREKYYECFQVYFEEFDASKMILMVSEYIENLTISKTGGLNVE